MTPGNEAGAAASGRADQGGHPAGAGLDDHRAASHLGVAERLSEVLNEKRSVSLEMAQRLGRAFGNSARFWLTMQMQYDIWHAERKSELAVKRLRWKASGAASPM